jgi:hypothetical protein
LTILESYGKSTEVHSGDLTINNPQLFSGGNFTLGGNLIGNGRMGIAGYANFVGSDQYILNTGETNIHQLEMNSSGSLTLRSTVKVINSLTLNKGKINTSAAAILFLDRPCLVTGGSTESYINGPVKKFGALSPYTLPLGKANLFKPVSITYNSDANQYTMVSAEYFNSDPTLIAPVADKETVSNCEYWKIDRTEGPGAASISFPTENCGATLEKDLNILYYDSKTSLWKTKTSHISNSFISLSDFTLDYGIYALGKGAVEAIAFNYFVLNKASNQTPVIIKGKLLRFVYNEEYLPGKLIFNIYDYKKKVVLKSTSNSSFVVPNKIYGMNEISLPLSSFIADDQPYLLEVVNSKGEKQYLLFKNSSI